MPAGATNGGACPDTMWSNIARRASSERPPLETQLRFIRNCLMLAACAVAVPVLAQAPLKMIVGFPPGATSDTLTRALAEGMRAQIGRAHV